MKNYGIVFGSGDPRTYTGINATFLFFVNMATGATVAPPSISELFAGTGVYNFQWGTTTPISFLCDAATTSPGAAGRYVVGKLDPSDRGDEYAATIIAIGTTGVAIGTTSIAIGTTGVAIGTTGVAIGTTGVAYAININSQNVVLQNTCGTTLVGIGNTSVSYGILNSFIGTTSVALGNTSVNYGILNFGLGTTSVAIGTTLIGFGLTLRALGNTTVTNTNTIISAGSSNAAQNDLILAQGSTNYSYLNSIGTLASSFGTNLADPTDLFGYLKRFQEILEGNNTYLKSTGVYTMSSRGSSYLLTSKTITNSVTMVTKT